MSRRPRTSLLWTRTAEPSRRVVQSSPRLVRPARTGGGDALEDAEHGNLQVLRFESHRKWAKTGSGTSRRTGRLLRRFREKRRQTTTNTSTISTGAMMSSTSNPPWSELQRTEAAACSIGGSVRGKNRTRLRRGSSLSRRRSSSRLRMWRCGPSTCSTVCVASLRMSSPRLSP